MAKRPEVRVAILGDSRDFSRAVRNVQGDARKLDTSFGNIGRSAGRMAGVVALGVGAAAVGVGLVAKSFVDAAIESQKVTKQTEAVIKSMGDVAGVTAGQVADLSTKLSMQTGIDDELIQSGSNILLTFANIRNSAGKTNKIFDRATGAALDMSVALGTDMTSASMIVGKALNDPVRGLTALRRSGIQFTAQQEDQIKAMVASGDLLGAQKVLLDELDRQFGGSAAAQATAGEKLGVIWGNLQEQLGAKLLPIFEKVATWLGEALPAAIDWAEPYIDRFIRWFEEDIAPAIGTAADAIGGFIRDSLEALSGWWDDNGPTIVSLAEDVGSALTTAWDGFVTVWNEVLKPAFDKITDWFLVSPGRMQALAAVAVAGFGLWAIAATIAAAASVFAMVAPFLPALALIGLIVALTGVTEHLIDKFELTKKASNFGQWIIDHGVGQLLGALMAIDAMIGRILGRMGPIKTLIEGGQRVLGIGEADRSVVTDLFPAPKTKPVLSRSKPPIFSNGGVMPGPRGVHSLAMVAGGETILPTHKGGVGGVTINLNGRIDNRTLRDLVYEQRKLQIEMSSV